MVYCLTDVCMKIMASHSGSRYKGRVEQTSCVSFDPEPGNVHKALVR